MSDHTNEAPFPRFALIWAGALIMMALVSASVSKWTGLGATRLELMPPVSTASLRFLDLPDGSVGVEDAASGRQIERYPPGTSGFVRVVLRSFAFDRSRDGVGADEPFVLSHRADGSFTLEDPATNGVVTLTAFGHRNAGVFEELLKKGKMSP